MGTSLVVMREVSRTKVGNALVGDEMKGKAVGRTVLEMRCDLSLVPLLLHKATYSLLGGCYQKGSCLRTFYAGYRHIFHINASEILRTKAR